MLEFARGCLHLFQGLHSNATFTTSNAAVFQSSALWRQVHHHHELHGGLHGDAGELLRQPGRIVPQQADRNGVGKLCPGY